MNMLVMNNQKGGVGRTPLAVHLAWFMAESGRRVLMIDADAQGNATDTLKRHVGETSAAGLFQPAARIVASGGSGITLAPADSSLTDVDRGSAPAGMTRHQNLVAATELFETCTIEPTPSPARPGMASLGAAP